MKRRKGLYHETIRNSRRRVVEDALVMCKGNRTYAARALGVERTYLMRLIRELGVDIPPAMREAS